MSDEWMMTMRRVETSTPGEYVGVAIVDFKIERRLMLTLNELDGLERALLAMEMTDVTDALRFTATINSDQWKYINVPWRSVSTDQFDTDSIVKLLDRSARKYWWRLEGTEGEGLKGVITCGGSEVVYDLSRDNLVPLLAKAEADLQRCDELEQTAQDEGVRAAIKTYRDAMGCIFAAGGLVKIPGGILVKGGVMIAAAAGCYLAADAARQEADKAKKRQQELDAERERNSCGKIEAGGGGDDGSSGIGNLRGGPDRLTAG